MLEGIQLFDLVKHRPPRDPSRPAHLPANDRRQVYRREKPGRVRPSQKAECPQASDSLPPAPNRSARKNSEELKSPESESEPRKTRQNHRPRLQRPARSRAFHPPRQSSPQNQQRQIRQHHLQATAVIPGEGQPFSAGPSGRARGMPGAAKIRTR